MAYPDVVVDGFDADDASIADARRNAAEAGVGDRVHFAVRDAVEPGPRHSSLFPAGVVSSRPPPGSDSSGNWL